MLTKSTKEIAKELKQAIKAIKGVKLSVTTDYSRISVRLMEAPFAPIVNNEIVYRGFSNFEREPKPFTGQYGVNHYTFTEDQNLTAEAKAVFELVHGVLMQYHWDKSDSMTDYFNCSFYIDYQVGKWDKPFIRK
ncbi:LPD29 domain-containing protein [Chryseolinea sp. T2]|uniref:LPD29 domain-containing protein n=1 Tax=Chryseolinea sp. T2 TaxID=3129255 RepID=UPI0030770F28